MAEPAQAQPKGSAAASDPAAVAIVRGNPSAEQVAALVAVLAARACPAGAPAPRNVRSEWSSRSRLLRAPLQRGPGGWRASALPR
jgi:Acyl-CoA carboxylase epsilon subunit